MKSKVRTHEHLLAITRKTLWDYEPYGTISRDKPEYKGDCSCGCKHYTLLKGELGSDWGVCTNTASNRCALLTFKHQGCLNFEENTTK